MDEATNLAEETFCAALEMAPVDRPAYLDQACANNPGLRTQVEGMLARHGKADKFITSSQPNIDVASVATELDLETLADLPLETASETEKQVGPYKLIEKLGEGGCGVVYLAEQEKPVRRRVALKIIKLGMDTRNFVARFKAECQALAMMDHPHIARVLDAGATEKGRPYFVMELVRGVKVTDFCDASQYDVRQRLELFIRVCQAIQHAHQKGIIHRDIKPSNVLVTTIDGVPTPKVIDFGIAKAVGGERLADLTVFTACEHLVGTPAYMSPEQAALGGVDVDTRSDIYSLGALLYELLTGKTPFDQQELARMGFDEMRRRLREQDPLRPSTRLGRLTADELSQVTNRRSLEGTRLKLLLQRELDWIVMKALEKDRDRRYQTAIGLGIDVQHYLDNEPVLARPPSRYYRFQKLVRRNRAVFVSIAAVSLALIAGFGTSTWLYFQEREARRQAQSGRQAEASLRRQAEAREVFALASSLVDKFQLAEADKLIGSLPSSDMAAGGAAVFRPLGDWAAVGGKWRRAAEYYSVLVPLDLFKNRDATTMDYTKYAVVLAEIGEPAAYENFCRDCIQQFGDTHDLNVAERVVKNSLLLPPSPSLLETLLPMEKVMARSIPTNAVSAAKDAGLPWRCLSLALYEYRRGHYDDAASLCHRVLDLRFDSGATPCVAGVHALLAMANQRLGQTGQARLELGKSRELIGQRSKTAFVIYQDGHGMWYDWFVARLLAREAGEMIDPMPSPATP
ncbi:MAG TPA: serine/threonine-protein kinase [Verrucomicrobiae bacterium]